MTTVSDVVEQTLRYLHSGDREEINQLSGSITANATSIGLSHDAGGIQTGADIEIDLEIFYVWSVSGSTATVQPAMRGTTAAAHSADAIISVNPKFPKFSILKAINDELVDLSSPANGLYRVATPTTDLTYNPASVGYDLTGVTDILDILEVRYFYPGLTGDWPILHGWTLARNMPTSSFASGYALLLTEPAFPGQSIRVRYKAPFTAVTTLAQDVNAISGLHAEATDILSLGAAARLMAPREVKRNFIEAQGDSRRAQEVPPGATLQSYRGLLALREQRIVAEATRLAQRYPIQRWP